jgi:hypothetical protein
MPLSSDLGSGEGSVDEHNGVDEHGGARFDPDEAPEYLEGLDYPVDKATLVSTAEGNGAPDGLVEMIAGLPLGEFSGQEELMNHLRAIPNRDN